MTFWGHEMTLTAKLTTVMIGVALGILLGEVTYRLLKSASVASNIVGGLMVTGLFCLMVISLWEIFTSRS